MNGLGADEDEEKMYLYESVKPMKNPISVSDEMLLIEN